MHSALHSRRPATNRYTVPERPTYEYLFTQMSTTPIRDATATLFDQAKAASKAKNWRLAAERWRMVIEVAGDVVPVSVWLGLCRAHRSGKQCSAAEDAIRQALGHYPDHPKLLVEAAQIATACHDWPTAAHRWQGILDTFGVDAPKTAWLQLAKALRKAGRVAQAEEVARNGLAAHPADVQLASEYATLASTGGDEEAAAKRWSQVLALFEKLAEPRPRHLHLTAYLHLTRAYRHAKRFAEAEAVLLDGLSRHPENSKLLMERARVAMDARDWPDAIALWREFLQKSADAPLEAYLSLARALSRLNAFSDAESTIERGLAQHGPDTRLLVEYARIAMAATDWEAAVQRWHSVLNTAGRKSPMRIYLELSRAYARQRAYPEALTTLEKGLAWYPGEHPLAEETEKLRELLSNQPDSPPDTFSSPDSLRLVASRIFGERAQVYETEPLALGLSNVGLFRHKVRIGQQEGAPASPVSGSPRRWFIEKRTTNTQETRIATDLLLSNSIPENQFLFPSIYHVEDQGNWHAIYMEYIPGVGHPPDLIPAIAVSIVNAVTSVNAFRTFERMSAAEVLDHWFRSERHSQSLDQLCHTFDVAPDHFSRLAQMGDALEPSDLVLSHNDIFWPNLGIHFDSTRIHCRLIDFAMLKPNIAGAEFHHFARVSIQNNDTARFFETLIQEYQRRTGLPSERLKLASYYYAMFRLIQRSYSLLVNQNNAGVAGKEFFVAAELYKRACELID